MLTTIKVYLCVMQSKFTKTNPTIFLKQGGARPVHRSWIRPCLVYCTLYLDVNYLEESVVELIYSEIIKY